MPSQPFPSVIEREKGIFFDTADVEFELENEDKIIEWLIKIIEQEDQSLRLLNFIFCSDQYLLEINQQYLQHDTLTDIITFPYNDPPLVEGDIFISIERVKENAEKYGVSFGQELRRVMAHGVLHLCGYLDKKYKDQTLMRSKEDEALSLYESLSQ